jgi:hypothetical protein
MKTSWLRRGAKAGREGGERPGHFDPQWLLMYVSLLDKRKERASISESRTAAFFQVPGRKVELTGLDTRTAGRVLIASAM